MKLISFDIGIKNMAYCIFDVSSNPTRSNLDPISFVVQDWSILNLMDVQEIAKHTCTCPLLSKQSKKKPAKTPILSEHQNFCGKAAKYSKTVVSVLPIENTFQNGNVQDGSQNIKQYFCEKHAKTSGFFMPSKEYLLSALSKKSKEELILLGQSHGLFSENGSTTIKTKKACLDILVPFFAERTLVKIQEVKRVGAGDTDLITIGRNMRVCLDHLHSLHGNISHVIMENQISPLAGRMKTVQGMLAQYYIMIDPSPEIEFISSANKLKDFTEFLGSPAKQGSSVQETREITETTMSDRYKQHKMDSITITQKIIQENLGQIGSWTSLFDKSVGGKNVNKHDDLADCFLQGLWYLKREKIITYADNLKIKIVKLT